MQSGYGANPRPARNSVLLAHAGPLPLTGNRFVGGAPAVECFFTISGFYMGVVLNRRYAHLRAFYFNRFLRLYPTYWLILFGFSAMLLVTGHRTFVGTILHDDLLGFGGKALMMAANTIIVGSDAMMFFHPTTEGLQFTADFLATPPALFPLHVIPQAWSLPIEMAFYAMAPFLVRSPARLFALALASLALRPAVYALFGQHDPWTYRFLPLELMFFCGGALGFHLFTRIETARWAQRIGAAMVPGLAAYIVWFERVPVLLPDTPFFPGSLAQLYLAVLAAVPFIFAATQKNVYDRALGDMSYAIYLVHLVVIGTLSRLPAFGLDPVTAAVAYSIIAAAALHFLAAEPIERAFKMRGGIRNRSPALPQSSCS